MGKANTRCHCQRNSGSDPYSLIDADQIPILISSIPRRDDWGVRHFVIGPHLCGCPSCTLILIR